MTKEEIRALMLASIEPMDPTFEAELVRAIEARLDQRDAERAAEKAAREAQPASETDYQK